MKRKAEEEEEEEHHISVFVLHANENAEKKERVSALRRDIASLDARIDKQGRGGYCGTPSHIQNTLDLHRLHQKLPFSWGVFLLQSRQMLDQFLMLRLSPALRLNICPDCLYHIFRLYRELILYRTDTLEYKHVAQLFSYCRGIVVYK